MPLWHYLSAKNSFLDRCFISSIPYEITLKKFKHKYIDLKATLGSILDFNFHLKMVETCIEREKKNVKFGRIFFTVILR